MQINGFKRRWRWFVTILLLIIIGVIWFAIFNMPLEASGKLLIERQDSSGELFHTFDFGSQQLQIVPLKDVTDVSIAYQMSQSSDGKRAAFVGVEGNEYRIYLAEDNFNVIRVLSTSTRDFQPEISPDGNTIVFMRSVNYFSALFTVDIATGIERPLTEYTNDLETDWSPDGKRIVFTTSRDGFQELYTMAADGSDLRRLTNNERQNDLRAQYSPDGRWIAYMTNYSVGDGTGEIWLMNADGSNQRRLTDNAQDDGEPIWSPDSGSIAFTRTQADRNGSDIFVYSLASEQIHQLTTSSTYEYQPVWSPDSAWIAYSLTDSSGQNSHIHIIRANATDQRPLLVDGENVPSGRGFIWVK